MIGVALGKRFERLLFFTAPISLAAIVVALVAFASNRQAEHVEARCLLQAEKVFSEKEEELLDAWEAKKKQKSVYPSYQLTLSRIWIYGAFPGRCYDLIDKRIDEELHNISPDQLPSHIRERAANLQRTPLSLYGVALPQDATVDLLVTRITLDLSTLTRVLQVVLLPVLLLWLGSLYSTRYRESLTTASAKSLAEVFPHIINLYPAFDQPSPRKRDPLVPYLKGMARFFYAWTRVGLLLIFILPPVVAYEYSLILGAMENFSFIYVIAGVVVGMFFLSNVIAEFLPTHYRKVFPDPTRDQAL